MGDSLKITMDELKEFAEENHVYTDVDSGAKIHLHFLIGGVYLLESLVACTKTYVTVGLMVHASVSHTSVIFSHVYPTL